MPAYLCDRIETSNHNYSLTEQVVGTWIDGTPVYEKTVYYAGGVTGTVLVPHGITNLKRIIDMTGSCHDIGYREGSQRIDPGDMPFPRVAADNNNIGVVLIDSTNVRVYVPNVFGDRITDIYMILHYTKET